jgi:hypothetical protein
MAWATPIIHAVGDILTASDWNISSNDLSFLAGTTSASVVTSQGTASTSYVDLATVGPAVTVTTGANALVILTTNISNNSASTFSNMGYAISGATTLAAADVTALSIATPTGSIGQQVSELTRASALTAGSNTFTAKYRVGSGTGTFANRSITVIPLP